MAVTGVAKTGVVGAVYLFAGVSALAALADWRILKRGAMTRAERVTRHLWRMSAALAVAAGAFFLGQPDFVPWPLRGTGFVIVPPLAALGLMVFWWVRTKWRGRGAGPIRTAEAV